MNRHELRKNAMIIMYQSLLKKEDPMEIIDEDQVVDAFIPPYPIDEYFRRVLQTITTEVEVIIPKVDEHLKEWTFFRLGFIEQAILLVAASEIKLGEVDRPIIINEAVELAKQYAEDDSYKLINGCLDRL